MLPLGLLHLSHCRRKEESEKSGSLHLPCETVQHLLCENTPARQVRGGKLCCEVNGALRGLMLQYKDME